MTITGVDNSVEAENKAVTVSASAINTVGVVDPVSVTLTIADDETIDYDADDDGLIEIGSVAQLNVVRYDLDGDGDPDEVSGDAAATEAAEKRLRRRLPRSQDRHGLPGGGLHRLRAHRRPGPGRRAAQHRRRLGPHRRRGRR